MRDNTDDVLVLGLDLLFNGYSLLLKNDSFFRSFVLSFCKSNDIHKKNLIMTINTEASNMQKSNK